MSMWGSLALGGIGSLLGSGGFGQGRDKIGPYNKYTVQDSSQGANLFAEKTLAEYMKNMGGVTANAGRTGQDIWKMYLNQSAGLTGGLNQKAAAAQALARATTGEMKGVYNNYGREAEQLAAETLRRELANAQSATAARRVGRGYSSADQMLGAGMRNEANNAYLQNVAGIRMGKADRMAGAIGSGRAQELATLQAYQNMQNQLGTQMLGMGMQAREKAFQLPNMLRVDALNQWLAMKHRPEYMYPNENLTANILGGSYQPVQTNNPLSSLGNFMSGLGGMGFANYMAGNNSGYIGEDGRRYFAAQGVR